MVYRDYEGKILYVSHGKDPLRTLAIRGLIVLVMILAIICIFWYHRGDLRDTIDGDISFLDVVYFTFITITTVGYGDIVPVTETARIIDAVVVTPLRIIIWLIFLGTAYEFIIPKYMEGYRLKNLQKTLKDHFIIVGYGSTGKTVADELVSNGNPKDRIIIVDEHKERTEEASNHGFIALRGDATREEMLNQVVISKAKHLIVVTGKDDTNVLVVLTARDLNPKISIVARANLEENTRLLRRGGANVVITPLVAGGKLMATSTLWRTAATVLEDILTSKHGLRVHERTVYPVEVGEKAKGLPKIVVLAVKRGKRIIDPPELDRVKLRAKDLLVYIKATDERSDREDWDQHTGPDDQDEGPGKGKKKVGPPQDKG